MTDLDISKGLIIRELISNYDDDPNNNFKKQLVLWEKNSSACLSLFLVHYFLWHPLNDLEVKPPDLNSFL